MATHQDLNLKDVNPSVPPNLRGVVDLNSPTQQTVGKFRELCLQLDAQAVVMIGIGSNGQVFAVHRTPDVITALGLLGIAPRILLDGAARPPTGE